MSDTFNFQEFYEFVSGIEAYKRFVEVGVYKGDSIVYLAKRLREQRPWGPRDFKVYAIDLWERVQEETDYARAIGPEIHGEFLRQIKESDLEPIIDVIQGDSVKAATMFRDHSVDFVFIDANHAYDHVKADIKAWLPKIASTGMIAGHDYTEPSCGVKQAVDEIFGNHVSFKGGCWFH